MNDRVTQAWQEYEIGKQYKQQLGNGGQYAECALNEAFYAGDQWKGIPSNGHDQPTINFIKPVMDKLTVDISSQSTKAKFTVFNVPFFNETIDNMGDMSKDGGQLSQLMQIPYELGDVVGEAELKGVIQLFNLYYEKTIERLQIADIDLEGLLDAGTTGDFYKYYFWENDIETGQFSKGDMDVLTVDTVNFYPGNPNQKKIQKQPYITITQRENLQSVINEAKENGATREEIDSIISDSEIQHQAGDRSKIELQSNDKCITLLKLWKIRENGKTKVYAEKSTKGCVIHPKWDIKMPIYPISHMNWRPRKNSINGQSEISGLIPNQLTVNKIYMMNAIYNKMLSYPKPIIADDDDIVWDNTIGEAIKIPCYNNENITNKIGFLQAPQNNGQGLALAENIMATTKANMGANDTSLGNGNSDNTSAMMVNIQQAAIPLKAIQQRYYRMKEDEARIFMYFWLNYYTAERKLQVSDKTGTYLIPFNGSRYKDYIFDVKIEVGQSQLYSEALQDQRVKNAMQYGGLPAYLALEYSSDFEGKSEFVKKAKEAYEQQQIQLQQKMMPQQPQLNAPPQA